MGNGVYYVNPVFFNGGHHGGAPWMYQQNFSPLDSQMMHPGQSFPEGDINQLNSSFSQQMNMGPAVVPVLPWLP